MAATSARIMERDASDSSAPQQSASGPVLEASQLTSAKSFNEEFRAASARPETATVAPLTLHGVDSAVTHSSVDPGVAKLARADVPTRPGDASPNAGDRQPERNDTPDHFSRTADVRLNFRALPGTTPEFQAQLRGAVNDTINQLNPQTQKLLSGLTVMSGNSIKQIDPHEKHEPAAVHLDKNSPYPNSVVFFEKEINKRGIAPEVVARHELAHPIDANDRFSGSAEFKRAYDLGMNRIPAEEKKALFAKFPPDKFPKPALRSEFFADLLSTKLGNSPEQTAYAKSLVKYFPEASDYIQRKFIDR